MSLHCHMISTHSSLPIWTCCRNYFLQPPRRPCRLLPRIHSGGSSDSLDSSVCCTPGIKSSWIISTSTALSRQACFHLIKKIGLPPEKNISSKSNPWPKSSKKDICRNLKRPMTKKNYASLQMPRLLPSDKISSC